MNSRRKGHNGEREFARELRYVLDIDVSRNLQQTRNGGYDLEVEGLAIEVKRSSDATPAKIMEWWRQAKAQASLSDRVPVLAYRQDRRPWVVRVPMAFLHPSLPEDEVAEVGLSGFCFILNRVLSCSEVA